MKEGYRLLGDFIQPVDERNKELKVDYLLGVSIRDRKSTRLNSSHASKSRMPSSA